MSYHIAGWNDIDLRAWLADATGLPVAVDNDCNVAALGEARCGAGRAYRRVFYTTLGTGMGGGMVVDGRLYHGARPGESEIGLMAADEHGTTFESLCCGRAVDARLRTYARRNPQAPLAALLPQAEGGEARHIVAALEAGDDGVARILDATAGHIAFAQSVAAHMFHPDVLVLGGGLALVGEPLRARVAARLPELMTKALKPGPPVLLSALGEDAVVAGALVLAADTRRTE
jgi:glucokinase